MKTTRMKTSRRMASGLSAFLMMALSGCVLPVDLAIGGNHGAVRGAGPLRAEARATPPFDGVSASGGIQVDIVRTDRHAVVVTAQENLMPFLETKVRGGVLFVGPMAGYSLHSDRPIRFEVQARQVREIRGSGAVDLVADLGGVGELWVGLSGASRARVLAEARIQRLDLSGASRYDGLDLESQEAFVNASGASHAVVWVHDYLEARVSGASHVRFAGDPYVVADVSGASTLTRY